MRFSKFVSTVLFAALTAASLTSCGSTAPPVSHKLSIVCTIFPEYDWIREITGSNPGSAEITRIVDSGTDIHSFQPTAKDIIKISSCDVFIYVGGESDAWVKDALAQAENKDMQVISLMDAVGSSLKEEELKEGMQSEEDEEDEEEGPEYDEHIWLSLRNAETACSALTDTLCTVDPANADTYRENLAAYTAKLNDLDGQFSELFASAPENKKTLIFGDRFPFRYFTDDYGLDYYAAFIGCSAETEASFETIAFLADKADKIGADTIYTIENSDNSIAESIIKSSDNKDMKIVQLDSMQSVTDTGTSYLSIMEQNLTALREAMD